jgi:hypothetical protein
MGKRSDARPSDFEWRLSGKVKDRNGSILLKNSKMRPLRFLAKLNRDRQFAA